MRTALIVEGGHLVGILAPLDIPLAEAQEYIALESVRLIVFGCKHAASAIVAGAQVLDDIAAKPLLARVISDVPRFRHAAKFFADDHEPPAAKH